MAGAVLPGEGDGANSVGVAVALRHALHPTTVTVHLPHTHGPVLKTQHTNVTAGLKELWQLFYCSLYWPDTLRCNKWLLLLSVCISRSSYFTFAQLTNRAPFLNTSKVRTVSEEDKKKISNIKSSNLPSKSQSWDNQAASRLNSLDSGFHFHCPNLGLTPLHTLIFASFLLLRSSFI